MKIAAVVLICIVCNAWVSTASRVLSAKLEAGNDAPVWSLKNKILACPDFEDIVLEAVQAAVSTNGRLAAGLLRLFFHDCAVNGCDGSVLNAASGSEKFAGPNTGLVGIDLIDSIKELLDGACPGAVSCADILAAATRDALVEVGGPKINLQFGRLDGLTSISTVAAQWLPSARANVFQGAPKAGTRAATMSLEQFFQILGFSVEEMVTLSGGHTIGRSRCAPFAERLAGVEGNLNPLAPELKTYLQGQCSGSNAGNNAFKVQFDFNGQVPPVTDADTFDNSYWKGLPNKWGLLNSDQTLYSNSSDSIIAQIERYSTNQQVFFEDFRKAMIKLSEISPGSLVQQIFPADAPVAAPKVPVYPNNQYGVRVGKCSSPSGVAPPATKG